MAQSSQNRVDKKPSKLWWFLAVILLLLFLLVQLPVSWLVARFAPNQSYVENISGNLWQGQAQWRLPAHMTPTRNELAGSIDWQWRPWELLWLQVGSDVTLTSGNSALDARIGIKRNGLSIQHAKGTLANGTIRQLAPIEWPATDISINDLSFKGTRQENKMKWQQAEGNLTWPGGQIGYPMGGRTEVLNLPAMKTNLSLEKEKLHFALVTAADERMGDIYLDADNMLDVQLTQRLLLNVKGYQGKAALDTAVVSVRQPLSSVGK